MQIFGEVYDVDSNMLKKLDELEEHPDFYVRTEEEILLTSEDKIKSRIDFNKDGSLTKAWIYFLPKFKAELLELPMFSSYSNKGSHGLKYQERYLRDPYFDHRKEVVTDNFARPEDVL